MNKFLEEKSMEINTIKDISMRIRKALKVLSMLPPVRVQGVKSTWPEYISDEHLRLSQLLRKGLNWKELAKIHHEVIPLVNEIPFEEKPMSQEISDADEVLAWFAHLDIDERLLVWNFNRVLAHKSGIKLKTCEALASSLKNSENNYIWIRNLDDLSFYYGCKGRSGLYYKYNVIMAKLFAVLKSNKHM